MAANINPIFVLSANKGDGTTGIRLTTANATRDLSTTTNGALLFTAGADGSRIESIDFVHSSSSQTQASVAAVGRIFLCSSAGGANARLIKEIALPAVTPSSIAVGATYTITFTTPLFLASGQYLWATISATQTAGGYDVSVYGGNY
jgi:hypothetical protein